MIDPPVATTDRMGLYRESAPLLRTCGESDEDPAPPEVTFTSTRISQSPSSDLLGNVQRPQAASGAEAIMHDESVEDNTKSAPEIRDDRAGDQEEVDSTIQGVQADSPSVREGSPVNDERNKRSEESQAPKSSCFRPPSRPIKQSKAPLTSTRSLRPRPNAVSTQPRRFPTVAVVIPVYRGRGMVANTQTNPSTRARSCGRSGGNNSSHRNNDRATRTFTRDCSPRPEISKIGRAHV